MPKKNVALPARMDLAINPFTDLKIAVLMFPFTKEVTKFCRDMEQVLRDNKTIYAPYRQLNNLLLASSSTLTYGFEKSEKIDDIYQYRALAVGKSNNFLQNIPTPDQIHDLIFAWAQTWTRQYSNRQGNKDEIESVCTRFLDAIENIPKDWRWEDIEPAVLIDDINSNNGLGYQAIPSLLATLLHEQTITIQLEDREQKITWCKVQGGGSSKTGLHLVSDTFKANYIEKNEQDDSEKEKEGYFAYRLDFHIHTQAGRFNQKGNLKPWVFLHLSCQRYAHEPLVDINYGRDISILMGMNTAPIDNYPVDSTLVKLTIDSNNKSWKNQLPALLALSKARPLPKPQEILNNPAKYGNLDNSKEFHKDEYYLIHTEGYKYNQEQQAGRGHGHNIDTGFSLKERADITSKILHLLNDVLIPDKPMECDIKIPTGKKTPLAMLNHEDIRKSLLPSALSKYKEAEKQAITKEKQNIIINAIKRASNKNKIYLFIIYRAEHTKKLVYQQLRESFLLREEDNLPDYLIVQEILITDSYLIEPIPVSGLSKVNKNFDEEIRKGHHKKRQAWQNFLKKNVLSLVENKYQSEILAIIEITKTQIKGIDPKQNIRGAIREACVLENINSQMLQTIKPTAKDDTAYSSQTRGRTLNAVLDITIRQTGTLYGLPSEVYKIAKIPENIAQKLDLIAFCRVKKNDFIGKTPFQYAVAVRLSATGAVDVLLPTHKQWFPYTEAAIKIGKLFHEVRKKDSTSIKQVQMKGEDLVKFVADTLVNCLENPAIAIIEADVWRNEISKDGGNNQAWFQLKNEYLLQQRDILNFNHVHNHHCQYQRNDEKLNNLLTVIRLRSGNETPQYVTDREHWNQNVETKDYTQLSGFIDKNVAELIHYFSIGRIPETQKKKQHTVQARNLSKIENKGDTYAANIAYKHQQMLEILPFFVRQDFKTEENIKALCRVPHYLRNYPAFTRGNISHPYPMHIGNKLIEDMLCIIRNDY
ncbi:hypothetical protein NIES4102_38050 [Chondrocystis sp. NIES-4102]|nr:hypothetical protein NIES4102_38050 [Chondrocystis sp. NIES-4102]